MATGGGLRQVVYLSNRPAVLAETLGYVRHFQPWLTQAVVLTPSPDEVRAATADAGLDVVVLHDRDVLAAGEQVPGSHSARNAFLRRALARRGPLDDVFLQSDDDYRPLKPVAEDLFVDDGRLVSYFFYDLARWRRNESTYDGVQHNSYLALSYLGAPHLAYASHMPQPLDRDLLLLAFDEAERISGHAEFCEWSLPLNHGRLVAPERFAEPRLFRTLGWPQYPHEWPFWQRPEDVTFENFYPELYRPGHLFAGLSTALDPVAPERQAFDKLARWHRFDLEAGRLRFPPGVANPWETSRGRRAFFRLARRTRKLYEYAALEERTALSELAGAVARLERGQGR